MNKVNAIRTFLVQHPRPVKILITSGDGTAQEVLPPKGVGGVTWAGVARTIEVLDPVRVELFDGEDKLIRAQSYDAETQTDGETTLPEVLKRDAESARLVVFAQLIANAYKFSVETAFTKMVDIFERLDQRQDRVEKRLEHAESQYRRVMQDRVDEAFDEADELAKSAEAAKADPITGLVSSFLGGAQQGAADKNGKKEAKP